jgi:DHA2 family multidrug resistance protein
VAHPSSTPLSGGRLALATVALSLANFMEVLDISIANVSIPTIAGDLGISPTEGTWVITSYAVSNAIAVMIAGWLAQRFGQVRVFTAAVVLFTLFSLLCGLSFTFPMLLLFRILQGAVAGLMVPLSQALIISIYPPAKRGLGMGIWAMTITVAPIIGPILGGWITDNFSWPWIFFINIPFGAVAALLTWRMLAARESPRRQVPIDAIGLGLIVAWVGALQIMLDKGNELDWFASPTICALALVAGIGCALFLVWELGDAHPVVELRLFKVRNFTAATAALMVGFALFFAGSVILLPLWLQTSAGYTATWAGLAIAPGGVLAMALSPLVGRSLGKVDPRLLASAAFAVFAAVSFLRARMTGDVDFYHLAMPQILQGVATACFFTPLMTMAISDLAPHQVANGSGLVNFIRLIATSFGASLVTTVWDHRQAIHRGDLIRRVADGDPAYAAFTRLLRQAGLTDPVRQAAAVSTEIDRQAAISGVIDIYWASAWAFLAIIGLVWVCRRPRAAGAGVPGH